MEEQTYGIEDGCSRVVVHFLKVINETTSGYREFAVWRKKHIQHENNIVFVCGRRGAGNKKDIAGSKVIWGNDDCGRIREKVKEILSICREKGIPIVFHIQQSAAIWEIIRACAGLDIRKSMIYTERNTFSGYDKANKKRSLMSAVYAKHLTFLSYASYEDYPGMVKWMKHNNMSVIEHGANGGEITCKDWEKRKAVHKPTLELVFTARIVPVKNHIFLLDVAEELEGIHISFIGEEQCPVIQNEIRRRHLESKVTVTGLVSREEVYKRLGEGDVYVSSSTLEGLPVSVLEAMHAGLPAVLSAIGPHIELSQYTRGIKILPLEKKAWVEELNRLKQMKTEELAEMGIRNAEAARRYFTLARMHKRYSRLYSLLES